MINHLYDEETLEKIITDYYEDFFNKRVLACVKKSNANLPIICFGNIDRYLASEVKIVTIGLNPSNNEFTEERFPRVPKINDIAHLVPHQVVQGLNEYFVINPYRVWFSAYERVLNCSKWDVTYGGQVTQKPFAHNYAVHIDFYSAIATSPTWSNLENAEKNFLRRTDIFDRLFAFLKPDIALFSTSEEEICKHFALEEKDCLTPMSFKVRDYIREYRSKNLLYTNTLFIWGKPNIKPFQGVATEKLKEYFKKK